jgi:hypothetical protein
VWDYSEAEEGYRYLLFFFVERDTNVVVSTWQACECANHLEDSVCTVFPIQITIEDWKLEVAMLISVQRCYLKGV